MKRFAITLSMMLAISSAAHAAAWQHQTDDFGHEAYQGSKDEKYLLAFICGDDADGWAFYILTPEPFEATTSYADTVPTTFTSNAKTLEISGVFKERTGSVSVHFESTPKLDQLYDLIANAKGDIKVRFFDKQMSFSSEGSGEALGYAAPADNPDDCNPYGM